MKPIRVGTRDSALALRQTRLVLNALQALDPTLCFEIVCLKTTGDIILDRPLDAIGGKGLFVRELDEALRAGAVDWTIHSLKDLPRQLPEDLPLAAFSPRGDVRDALIAAPNIETGFLQSADCRIGTGARRRVLQLQTLYPKASFCGIRGNVQTRLNKLRSGACDATVLAMAGLERLELTALPCRVFTTDEVIPAAGQGILAVQTRRGEHFPVLQAYNNRESALCGRAERAFVAALQGDCSDPIAAYATLEGESMTLRGFYAGERVSSPKRGRCAGDAEKPEVIGRQLAELILKG